MENRLVPMRELLGEMLLDANEPAAAFEGALRVAPNRPRSWAGAARAAQQTRNVAKAEFYLDRLRGLSAEARAARPDLVAGVAPAPR